MVIEDTGQLRGPKKTGSPKTTGLSSIIHRGVNNKGPEIALRMNELFVQSENLQATCFGFLKSQVPGWAPEKGPNGTKTSVNNLTVTANAHFVG